MKFATEYRDKTLIVHLKALLHKKTKQSFRIMEVCGGQTHSIMRYGIHEMLPREIELIHGPGCPVCVTPEHLIDHAMMLAQRKDHIICSFGDMLRVPGSQSDLMTLKAKGCDVRIILSPLEAVSIAEENPAQEVTLFAVGFETTAPASAMAVMLAKEKNLKNFSLLASHVLVPPALDFLLQQEGCMIDGLLAAGHVCTIEGSEHYHPIAQKYKVPIVITGFEPVDILQGLIECVELLQNKDYAVRNQYRRCVKDEGNIHARSMLSKVFTHTNRTWRGIGSIPLSGLALKQELASFDAALKFPFTGDIEKNTGCISGEILQGKKKPCDCPHFGRECSPSHPLGAPMVSSEGACSAYFKR
jgi:hydrogenase expression/formation protein HypD